MQPNCRLSTGILFAYRIIAWIVHTVYQRPKKELKRPTSQIERIIEKICGIVSIAMRINSNTDVEISGRQERWRFSCF